MADFGLRAGFSRDGWDAPVTIDRDSAALLHRPYREEASDMPDIDAVRWLVMICSDLVGSQLRTKLQDRDLDPRFFSGVPAEAEA